jgi:hypothetical protein
LKSKKPDVMRLVGTEGAYGEVLGLTRDWAARLIRDVGNYGEVSSKTSAQARTSAFRAGSISCGAKAELSARRRFDGRRGHLTLG